MVMRVIALETYQLLGYQTKYEVKKGQIVIYCKKNPHNGATTKFSAQPKPTFDDRSEKVRQFTTTTKNLTESHQQLK
jgi:hypothetical protein